MNYNLTRAEYKQLVSLVKDSILVEDDSTSHLLPSCEYGSRKFPLKKYNRDLFNSLLPKNILLCYIYHLDEKELIFDLSPQFIESDLYKSIKCIDQSIVKDLKTESGLKLYGYFELNSKVVDDKRTITVNLEELRNIFDCNADTYTYYKDLRVRKLDPAIKDLEKVGYNLNYEVIKKGTKVEFIKLSKILTSEEISKIEEMNKLEEINNSIKPIDIESEYAIQEAIGRLSGMLYNYTSNLGATPKDLDEYILDFRSSMIITNRENKHETADCVRAKVYRSDFLVSKSPIYVRAEIENNELRYKITFNGEHRFKGEFNFECSVKTEYEVVVALENIKRGILQGIDFSDINIKDKRALHAPLDPINDVEDFFNRHRYIPCENLMHVIDIINKNVEEPFKYVFEISYFTRDGVTLMSVNHKDDLWSVQIRIGSDRKLILSKIVENGYHIDNIEHKNFLSGSKEENPQYVADDIMDIFKIICGEDMNDTLANIIKEAIATLPNY